MVLSPSGRHVAYPARNGDDHFLVVDGRPVGPYAQAGIPQFSPDEKKVAFGAQVMNEFWWKVVDVPEKR